MIEIKLDGFRGRLGSLFSGEVTATGIIVRLHGPLADAINAIVKTSDKP